MRRVFFKLSRKILTIMFLGLCIDGWSYCFVNTYLSNDNDNDGLPTSGQWDGDDKENRSINNLISITQNSQYLTIQDSNPVNTITVKITSNETGATVFENVYPQGQTSFIVIPMDGWSAGSYTIELFGRENNGYLWGTFQVLP